MSTYTVKETAGAVRIVQRSDKRSGYFEQSWVVEFFDIDGHRVNALTEWRRVPVIDEAGKRTDAAVTPGRCPNCDARLGRSGKCPALCEPVEAKPYQGPKIIGLTHLGRIARNL